MTRSELVNNVLVKLDEMLPNGQQDVLLDEPTPINEYIESLLDEAARDVLMLAPMYIAVNSLDDVTVKKGHTNKPNYIELPEKYLRLNSIMLDEWVNPVSSLIDKNADPNAYMIARNPYAGAGANKPKAALSECKMGEAMVQVIELFPSTEGTLGTITYVGDRVAEECDERLQPIIALQCALKIAGTGNKQNTKYLGEELQKQLTTLNSK